MTLSISITVCMKPREILDPQDPLDKEALEEIQEEM